MVPSVKEVKAGRKLRPKGATITSKLYAWMTNAKDEDDIPTDHEEDEAPKKPAQMASSKVVTTAVVTNVLSLTPKKKRRGAAARAEYEQGLDTKQENNENVAAAANKVHKSITLGLSRRLDIFFYRSWSFVQIGKAFMVSPVRANERRTEPPTDVHESSSLVCVSNCHYTLVFM